MRNMIVTQDSGAYLFIEPQKPNRITSRSRRRKVVEMTTPTRRRRTIPDDRRRVLLSAAMLIVCCSHSVLFSGAEEPAKLPTVIVRGFLNYRTTVDGTVLLFTPDAGGQQSSSTATISATPVPVQMQPTQSVEFRPQAQEDKEDQWRPIQATPPLRPMQSTFQPSEQQFQLELTGTTSISPPGLGQSSSSSSRDFMADLGQPIAAGELRAAANKPTVQTDELAAGGEQRQPEQSTQTRAVAKARRPSLGFHGQGARANSRPTLGEQPSNSINGIRRPGLPTSTTTSSPSADLQQQQSVSSMPQQDTLTGQPVVSAFQARLQSAKLRNKFRKPGSSALGNSGNSNSSNSSTLTSVVALAPFVEKEDLHPVGSSSATNIAAASQWPVAADLQPRSGDIFNPGAPAVSPVVGSDEILLDSSSSSAASGLASLDQSKPDVEEREHDKLESRLGEQRPGVGRSEPELLTGGLTGSIESSGAPLTFDSFFQNDQPPTVGASKPAASASEHKPHHLAPRKKNNNDKINGWLDHHHNKLIPRPPPSSTQPSLAPSFASNIPSISPPQPTPISATPIATSEPASATPKLAIGSTLEEPEVVNHPTSSNGTLAAAASQPAEHQVNGSEVLQMQTITKTYSTVMTSLKTRLVPLQVKSSTGVHTLTESYVITKLMTAYQTMPVGEFILPEPLSTRAPFEIFNEPTDQLAEQIKAKSEQAPVAAPSNFAPAPAAPEHQEQPITLQENSQKSPNDWLHDFTSQNPFNPSSNQPQQQQQQQQQLANMLEQQAQEANLANLFGSGEPLDQLASGLDPATLLADGSINIPDLNNPLVLAAAIQNPQLAAVILAAQQLRLRQQQQRKQQTNNNNQVQPSQMLLQPSYSTSLSTNIKPSTYVVRDTMYTTRLVSFKDGRTVRTRTVSEPGSVIEQTLTTMATEVTPVTITIRPTGVLAAPSMQATAAATNNQATINNALFATQLASLLARRQQQVQPAGNGGAAAPSQNQLALLQQLLAGQQLPATAARPQQQQQLQQQFQPNLQQLLQSMQQQQQPPVSSNQPSGGNSVKPQAQTSDNGAAGQDSSAAAGANLKPESTTASAATPPLPALPSKPIVTTLTNLQVRTYTVHNAFKTIYRTITSTQLVTSTILPALTRNSQLPQMGG